MDNIFKIKFDIENSELDEIENWLKEESKTSKNSFYNYWNLILVSYSEKRMAIIKNEKQVIGYTIWSIGDIYIEIELFEIKPSYRKKRVGEYFIQEISKYFKNKNFLPLKVFCPSAESGIFWKKNGIYKIS